MSIDAAILGGGAAGFFAAANLAPSNACFDPRILVQNYPRGGRALLGPFTRFQPRDTVEWFQAREVALKTEADGRIFPVSDSSSTIVDYLLDETRRLGVQVHTRSDVVSIEQTQGIYPFRIHLKNGRELRSRLLLISTGGERQGFRLAQSLGHTVVPPVPSLFTFHVSDARIEGLAGVSLDKTRLELADSGLVQTGPLLVTHWGLSGPAVLKLSAWGARILYEQNYHMNLSVNWLPEFYLDGLYSWLQSHKAQASKRRVSAQSSFGAIPLRLWQRLAAAAGISDDKIWADINKQALYRLAGELTQARFQIQGKGVFKEEFVSPCLPVFPKTYHPLNILTP